MCGIAGIYKPDSSQEFLIAQVGAMISALDHRGPDADGIWCDDKLGISLGHRRLAIVDLSKTGHQPMISSSGKFVITFNGEIYNHKSLRRELAARGVSFRGTSDTEVFLATIEEYGLDGALSRALGMFAFALANKHNNSLILCRDRIGEKPLYFATINDGLVFASELKALQKCTDWRGNISRQSLAQLVQYGFIASPTTIFENVNKLPAGHFLSIHSQDSRLCINEKQWWDYHATFSPAPRKPILNMFEAVQKFDHTFEKVIQEQCSADVPVGTLLSGGIDSSVVTTAASRLTSVPIKTFTVGYKDRRHDESRDAERIANVLGTDHYSKFVTEDEVLSLIGVLPRIYDEPFADYSQIPTALIASFAKQKVKVVLTGDGGDEMFSGYNRYSWAPLITSVKNHLPSFVTQLAVRLLLSEQTFGLSNILQALPRRYRITLPGEKLNKTASFLQTSSEHKAYLSLLSSWQPPVPVMGSQPVDITYKVENLWASQLSFAEKMRHTDALIYLPDDVLVKVDRATMAYGLEARPPLLDPRIIAFANHLPTSLMQNGHKGKLILRNWLKQHIPESYFDRPKSGFSFPLADWLRGPLKPWASELLAYDRLIEEAYFQAAPVKAAWDDHLAMKTDNHGLLWPILMFQAWNNCQSVTTTN